MKIEQREFIGPKTFYQSIREAEDHLFPGRFSDKYDFYIREGQGHRYMYHAPSHHVSKELLTTQMLSDLRDKNKSMLSVGSGAAHMERLLVENFAVPKPNILLSDVSATDLPDNYPQKIFDMTDTQWPHFDRKFDYVVFPESLVAVHMKYGPNMDQRALTAYNGVLQNALAVLNEGGEIYADGYFRYVDSSVSAFLSTQNVGFSLQPETLLVKKR